MVHPDDVEGMARSLLELAKENSKLRKKLTPRRDVIERFRLEVQQEKFVKAIGEVAPIL